jgi:hypothetical protein
MPGSYVIVADRGGALGSGGGASGSSSILLPFFPSSLPSLPPFSPSGMRWQSPGRRQGDGKRLRLRLGAFIVERGHGLGSEGGEARRGT